MAPRPKLTLDDPRMMTVRQYLDGHIDSRQGVDRLCITMRSFNRLVQTARRIDPSLPNRVVADFRLRTDALDWEDLQRRAKRSDEVSIDWYERYRAQGFDEAAARSLAGLASWVSSKTVVNNRPLRLVPPLNEGVAV